MYHGSRLQSERAAKDTPHTSGGSGTFPPRDPTISHLSGSDFRHGLDSPRMHSHPGGIGTSTHPTSTAGVPHGTASETLAGALTGRFRRGTRISHQIGTEAWAVPRGCSSQYIPLLSERAWQSHSIRSASIVESHSSDLRLSNRLSGSVVVHTICQHEWRRGTIAHSRA